MELERFSIFSFIKNIMETLVNAGESVIKVLNYQIKLDGLANVITKIIKFFGGEVPQSIINLSTYSISLLTIGGVLLGSILIIIIIKKIIPFF